MIFNKLAIFVSIVSCISNASDIIGELTYYKVKDRETLYDIARKFDLGINEITAANPGVDTWIPRNIITIPSMYILPSYYRQGIIINKAELRLYFFSSNAKLVRTFPVSLGILGHETPMGITKIKYKQQNPHWKAPISMRLENPDLPSIIPPGPNNPLGQYVLFLEWPSILIHGTNKPWSIGAYNSYGCIRMYPEDIRLLFDEVKVGGIVSVIYEPIKLGLLAGDLYLEVHHSSNRLNLEYIKNKILKKYREKNINEEILKQVLKEARGIPVKISN